MDKNHLDQTVARLQQRKDDWARLPLSEKIHHLGELRRRTGTAAQRWVAASLKAKALPSGSTLAGEEWSGGPWAFLHGINRYVETLVTLDEGGDLLARCGPVRTLPNGQVAVEVFPLNIYERLLLSGIHAEVWMEPGVTAENLRAHMASNMKAENVKGRVSLVLGAGNVSSITPMDVLHKLLNEHSVCIVKMNPVNDYLRPIFEEIFTSLIAYGFVAFVYGGVEVGDYLAHHTGVDELHMTGSAHTYNAIVFGLGEEGEARRKRNEPLLHKHFTAELGNVTPTIVVPGPWTETDLRFQAEHIFTQKMQNGGFNCVAAQVLVTPAAWPQTGRLLYHLRTVIRSEATRVAYYPGAAKRVQAAIDAHPEQADLLDPPHAGVAPRTLITDLDPHADSPLFHDEVFGSVLAQTSLPGASAGEFLAHAVRFCNEELDGTLAVNLIVHPQTLRREKAAIDRALADLRYGAIGVNLWAGAGFLLSQTSWGAFPGQTPADVGSGIGQVHNTFFFDRPQKSVLYGNFYPFPRNLPHGEWHFLPKPPWFITHRQNHSVGWRMASFAENPGWLHLPGLFIDALRG
ncbi:aldehyde dehydrogenase family protein [bacterium]|nr:aldehyde dehydrogenase family protein [bacterium]